MDTHMSAIELTGVIDEHQRLHLDSPLIVPGPVRVKVIVLYPHADEISEAEWLQGVTRNDVFTVLHDPAEDIYTLEDGKPFDDQA